MGVVERQLVSGATKVPWCITLMTLCLFFSIKRYLKIRENYFILFLLLTEALCSALYVSKASAVHTYGYRYSMPVYS